MLEKYEYVKYVEPASITSSADKLVMFVCIIDKSTSKNRVPVLGLYIEVYRNIKLIWLIDWTNRKKGF